jgi:hypothetical protein
MFIKEFHFTVPSGGRDIHINVFAQTGAEAHSKVKDCLLTPEDAKLELSSVREIFLKE